MRGYRTIYQKTLIEALGDPKEAKAYFDAILEECKECNAEESRQLLLLALRNIAEAQGGFTKLAAATGLGRESLYKTLSPQGNPKLSTVIAVANALLKR